MDQAAANGKEKEAQAANAVIDEILEGYPDLEREDIQQAIECATWLAQERVYSS